MRSTDKPPTSLRSWRVALAFFEPFLIGHVLEDHNRALQRQRISRGITIYILVPTGGIDFACAPPRAEIPIDRRRAYPKGDREKSRDCQQNSARCLPISRRKLLPEIRGRGDGERPAGGAVALAGPLLQFGHHQDRILHGQDDEAAARPRRRRRREQGGENGPPWILALFVDFPQARPQCSLEPLLFKRGGIR